MKIILPLLIGTLLVSNLSSYEECCNFRGGSYYDCRQTACIITSILVGTAVIAGLIAIVVNENHCGHAHD